jgi:putative DNA primase/helicase
MINQGTAAECVNTQAASNSEPQRDYSTDPFTPTDAGNAARLAAWFKNQIAYVPEWGWLAWDGKRWALGELDVRSKATQTARKILGEAAICDDRAERIALTGWSEKSQNAQRIGAMLWLAQPSCAAKVNDFDNDQWALNCTNGTLDLRTATLRPHNPLDRLTKISAVEYDSEAKCDTWLSFLDRVMGGNVELIKYLQRAIGYSLIGGNSEQRLFFCYGNGANGKSVFIETVAAIFADYCIPTRIDTFVQHRTGGIPNDVARLAGARLVTVSETADGQHLHEPLIKDLTGGDTITARYLHKEYFDFKPQFKIWIRGNHKPVIRGTDDGIWRRIDLIPFTVQIPEQERDPNLLDKLRGELSGVLTWAIEGCRVWQSEGLRTPESVRVATKQYREEMDTLGLFLSEHCVVTPAATATATELWEQYKQWATDAGFNSGNQHKFGRCLTERGFNKERTRRGVVYVGIGLSVNHVNLREPSLAISDIRAHVMGNKSDQGTQSFTSYTPDSYRLAKDGEL